MIEICDNTFKGKLKISGIMGIPFVLAFITWLMVWHVIPYVLFTWSMKELK